MLNLLIADSMPETQRIQLEALGLQIHYAPELSATELPEHIQQTNILCVRSTKVTKETILRGKRLMLIVRVGSGYNTIDVESASARGVYLANCPGKNAVAVAELTLGLILALDRRIPAACQALREQKWNKKEFSRADGLKGKTIGIVGLGNIGQAVGHRLRGFGVKLLGWTRNPEQSVYRELDLSPLSDLEQICIKSDIITVHLPLNDQTKGLFNQHLFSRFKTGACFINTSRGELHDEVALLEAMENKGLRVGLDVYNHEPAQSVTEIASPILSHPNFIGTPHIGASTTQAQMAVADEAVRVIGNFLSSGEVPNCVNLAVNPPVACQLIIRHYDRVGVLASVMNLLRKDNINIEGMRNTVFAGAKAAVASLRLSRIPGEELLTRMKQESQDILQLTITRLSSP